MGGSGFQVVAGRKGLVAGAGHNRQPHLLVGHEVVPHRIHFDVAGGMHRVHNLGAVERDVGEMLFFLILDEFQIHRSRVLCEVRPNASHKSGDFSTPAYEVFSSSKSKNASML